MKKVLFFAAVSLLALSSCKKDKDDAPKPKEKIFKGAVAQFQHGKAWTWYEVDESNNPVRIAVAVDDAAMASLDRNPPGTPGHHHENGVSLKLHPTATSGTLFQHILLDWNPVGHEPEPIYGKPHFDFHFYTTTDEERKAIPEYTQAQQKFDNAPAAGFMPPTYINPGGGVPQMGAHWLDVTTPELNGAPFTETFIFGSYDGKVTFMEPMITEAFILANPSFQRSIPQPAKYQAAGWHPTKMRIEKKDGATNIILEGFVKRQAS
ncbi:MAG TPA: hypothetical protein VM871_07820 [Flavisolibacter sp.]|jgi:hypothetical protein|nr:hypothetical protein [Flavisolibacter sp.]